MPQIFQTVFRKISEIGEESFAHAIVKQNYRTAEVFQRYQIEYCCGARWPLKMVCELKGIDFNSLQNDLYKATRVNQVSPSLLFDQWDIDFLIDYIIHIHHQHLRHLLPLLGNRLEKFVEEHSKKFSWLPDLMNQFNELNAVILPHLLHEEEIIFPYIRQVAHAYNRNEPYASQLVRTLRKPVEEVMLHEHEMLFNALQNFRTMTNNYTPPANACTSHHLVFSLLSELDDDLSQHVYLENDILFPRALAMEKELLDRPS